MEVFLQRPVIFFLIAGIGCGLIAVFGLIDAVKLWRARTRPGLEPQSESAPQSEPPSKQQVQAVSHPHLRFAASLILLAGLAFFTFQLLSSAFRMAPRLSSALELVDRPVPEFRYARIDLDGAPEESLAEHRGDVVLLNLWATWCPPCRHEMPALERLHGEYSEHGLEIVHVSTERPDVLRQWLAENPMSTRHGRADRSPIPAPALPTTLVIDREGIVRDVMVGGRSYGAFEKAVTPWL